MKQNYQYKLILPKYFQRIIKLHCIQKNISIKEFIQSLIEKQLHIQENKNE